MRRNGLLTRLVAAALLAVSANSLAQASTFDRPPADDGDEPALEMPAASEQPL